MDCSVRSFYPSNAQTFRSASLPNLPRYWVRAMRDGY